MLETIADLPADPPRASSAAIDPVRIAERVDRSLLTRVRRLIERHPKESLRVVRGWMGADGWGWR